MEWGFVPGLLIGAAFCGLVGTLVSLRARSRARTRERIARLARFSGSAPAQAAAPSPAASPLATAPPEPPRPVGAAWPTPFASGPAPAPTGAVFARWRHFGASPRLVRAIDRLRGGLAGAAALSLLQKPRLQLGELERIIATDPVLTSTILRLANSPLYGMRSQVTDLSQAIGIMGLTGMQTVLYAELLDAAVVRCGLHPALRLSIQEHLAVTASLAQHIAPAFPGLDTGELHTLAILHDIGKLALYQGGESAFLPDVAAEVAAFGADHALTGALVCRGFELPEPLLAGIALHHAPAYVEIDELEADLAEITAGVALCLADRLAHHLLSDTTGGITITLEPGHRSAAPAGLPGIRDSYRFLVKESALTARLTDPGLGRAVEQTRALVRDLAGARHAML